MTEAKQMMQAAITESELQGFVTTLARLHGWLAYHTHDSRRSEAGFPDLTLVRDGRIIFAELKSEKGRITPAQQKWLDWLGRSSAVDVYVWRPSDLDTIDEVLR